MPYLASQASGVASALTWHRRTDSATKHLLAPCAADARGLESSTRAISITWSSEQPGGSHIFFGLQLHSHKLASRMYMGFGMQGNVQDVLQSS